MILDVKTNFSMLYRIAWYLSVIMLILIPIQIIIFVIAPPPNTVLGLFELYHRNPFLGLLSLDFLYLFNNIIIVVIYLALFVILYQDRHVAVLIALILGLIGIACYYPTNPAFEILNLSNQYYQSQPEQLNIYLAAGEALMASYKGTSFDVYYILNAICLLLFAFDMLKSSRFKKPVALLGLLSGLFMLIPSTAGVLGMIFSLLSLIPWMAFVALLMIKFKNLSKNSL